MKNTTYNENSIEKERENGLVFANLTDLVPGPIVFGISVFIVIVLLRERRMRDVSNIMIANAAMGDALSAVVLMMSEYVSTVNHTAEHIYKVFVRRSPTSSISSTSIRRGRRLGSHLNATI